MSTSFVFFQNNTRTVISTRWNAYFDQTSEGSNLVIFKSLGDSVASCSLLNQSCEWGLIMTHSCPQFWQSKKNSNSSHFIELCFGVLEQMKPQQPIGQAAEFKFESKFKLLPTRSCSLAITPEDYSRRQSKDLTAKSMAKLFGLCSGTAWAGWTG